MYAHKAYFIETLTPTHVGSEDTYGVVDLAIQKDPVSHLPVFRSHSVKGAIRNHFVQYRAKDNFQKKNGKEIKPFTFDAVFGAEKPDRHITELDEKEKNNEEVDETDKKDILKSKDHPQNGLVRFHEARLLTLPLRATQGVYRNATCPHAILDYLEMLKRFQVENIKDNHLECLSGFFEKLQRKLTENSNTEFLFFNYKDTKPEIEDFEAGNVIKLPTKKEAGDALWKDCNYEAVQAAANALLSPPGYKRKILQTLAVFQDDLFSDICEDGLPVIARNKLDQGKSENLFYEEMLPRRSVLWFMTGVHRIFSKDAEDAYHKAFSFFEQKLASDLIQMGADDSVGYGVTHISQVGKAAEEKKTPEGGKIHE